MFQQQQVVERPPSMESCDHHQQDAAGPLVDQSAEVAIFREEKAGQDLFQDFLQAQVILLHYNALSCPVQNSVIET